jgi:cytochrome c2
VYAAFNGLTGTEDPVAKGYVSIDGLHPSDAGHELIAALLGGAVAWSQSAPSGPSSAHPVHASSANAPGPDALQGASGERGRSLFGLYCGACHRLEGIPLATGILGPDLTGFESRGQIAGLLPNTQENLARWLANPAAFKPGSLMPPLGLNALQTADLVELLLPSPIPTPDEEPSE